MHIRPLTRETCAGRSFTVRYETGGYYDITRTDEGFRMVWTPFDAPREMSFSDTMFGDWLDAPVLLGAFEGDRLLGFAEGSHEQWNNRWRISNLCVFDEKDRRRGVGGALMNAMLDIAGSAHARMAVLETQTCNERAIRFYQKHGFEVIGFDLYAYSNNDPQRHEVRLEMGRRLPGSEA